MRFLVLLLLIGVAVWYFFLRKPSHKSKSDNLLEETMVECCECQTYVSSKEAIYHKGKYFCSKECLTHKGDK